MQLGIAARSPVPHTGFMHIDTLDADIIAVFMEEPGVGVLECSRRLKVARATVQGRLDKLHRTGAISGIVPRISPAALGYPVITFCSIEMNQSMGHEAFIEALEGIPEILEMHIVSGNSDILVKIVAKSTADLQRVLSVLSQAPGVARTSSVLALSSPFENRLLPLVRSAVVSD